MARFEIQEAGAGAAGRAAETHALFQLGVMYAIGRDCAVDLVAAHKWFNIAAIKGSDKAANMRAELATSMSKAELAHALRAAREWMTTH